MHKILFFDDVLVNRRENVERRFHGPQWVEGAPDIRGMAPLGEFDQQVVPSPAGDEFLYTLAAPAGSAAATTVRVYRGDGFCWDPVKTGASAGSGFDNGLELGLGALGMGVLHDVEPVPESGRYKMAVCSAEPVARNRRCYLLTSEDGLTWRGGEGAPFHPRESDCFPGIYRNHRTGHLQVTFRNQPMDRRVFSTETPDLVSWSTPRLALQPSPCDPAFMQLYGMQVFRYADMFLGLLLRYHTSGHDPKAWKNVGVVDTELVYSYDGLCWNRTHRAFLARRDLGLAGGASLYGSCLRKGKDCVHVYATGTRFEHHRFRDGMPGPGPAWTPLVGRLRSDGFVGLASTMGRGTLTTDALFVRAPELRLNVCAPHGSARVQICGLHCEPIAGYTFDESVPIEGDGLAAPARWRERDDLSRAMQADSPYRGWLRIQVELEQAELFSLQGDFGVLIHSGAPGRDYL